MRIKWMTGAALVTGCTGANAQIEPQIEPMHHSAPVTVAPKAVVTPIIRTGTTISGQPLRLPQGASEVAAAAVEIPIGGSLPIHKHSWSRLDYVERGSLTVVNLDTGASLDFAAGQLLPEVIDQWHEARANGTVPVRIIVIDLVPPGVVNMVMKPAQ
jgi:quercetin dioxygenase-like cupin family protein